MRKIFEMGNTVKLVTECPDEVEKHGFIENFLALSPVAIGVSAASLQCVMKILMDLIRAYHLLQRDQVMVILDEEQSVETAGMMATLL